MYDNIESTTKKITFEGQTYEVPVWVEWVARDEEDGSYGYRYEPTKSRGVWTAEGNFSATACVRLIPTGGETCWGDSLKRV